MDYQGNSNKGKEQKETPEKKLEKVVVGEVVVKQPSVGKRFRNIFLGADLHTTADYIIGTVLLPALRDLVVQTVSKGTDRLVYGDSSPRPNRMTGPSGYAPRVQYHNPIHRPTPTLPTPTNRWQPDSRKAVQDVVLGTKQDADTVVESMIAIVEQYEIVSLADLYELLGLPSSPIDNKWGWNNLASITTHQTKDGWAISLPPLEEIQ